MGQTACVHSPALPPTGRVDVRQIMKRLGHIFPFEGGKETDFFPYTEIKKTKKLLRRLLKERYQASIINFHQEGRVCD